MSLLFVIASSWAFLSISATTGRPILRLTESTQLETYEELSENPNIFVNLTFDFSCSGRPAGFYADQDFRCRVFHACDEQGQDLPLICSDQMIFDQKHLVCDSERNVDCETAHEWYHLNERTVPEEEVEEREGEKEVNESEQERVGEDEEEVLTVKPLPSRT